MKTTLIIEINSHPCNECHKKLQASRFVKMQTVSRLEHSGCNTFWTEDKKQFNL